MTPRPGPARRPRRALAVALAAVALAPAPASAQQTAGPPNSPSDTTAFDSLSVAARGVSPGGAFLRAALVPGWGHASIGSYTRAGFYFTLEAASIYGLLRTRARLSEARERAALRESVLRADLTAEGVVDPDEIEERLDEDAELEDLRGLRDARGQQREDWIAFGIFLLFLSGADAFVSAHLADFPAPIELEGGPTGAGRMELGVRVPIGR